MCLWPTLTTSPLTEQPFRIENGPEVNIFDGQLKTKHGKNKGLCVIHLPLRWAVLLGSVQHPRGIQNPLCSTQVSSLFPSLTGCVIKSACYSGPQLCNAFLLQALCLYLSLIMQLLLLQVRKTEWEMLTVMVIYWFFSVYKIYIRFNENTFIAK